LFGIKEPTSKELTYKKTEKFSCEKGSHGKNKNGWRKSKDKEETGTVLAQFPTLHQKRHPNITFNDRV